jgi:Cu+-exporting ATPase
MDEQHQQCTLRIENMNCASCVSKIEHRLDYLSGVMRSSVNFASGKASIEYDPQKISEKEILRAISDLGYPTSKEVTLHEHPSYAVNQLLVRTIIAFVLSLLLALNMFSLGMPLWIQLILATLVQFGGGYPFYQSTWFGLKHWSVNMDMLVAIGTTAAYGYSLYSVFVPGSHALYFETSAFLISFILLGKLLELKTREKANAGMHSLLSMQPKMAHVLDLGEIHDLPIENVEKGAIFIVRPGERVPLDGVIAEGNSHLNESMLTGESVPVHKKQGQPIFAGTVNQEGLLKARAIGVGEETALGHIIRIVEQAQASKAPIQRVADRVTAFFVPVVLLIALMTFLMWSIVAFDPKEGLINAIAVLVVACPCALGLATPTVIMVACNKAAKAGILIKDAQVLERAQSIQTLFLDKTGTITEGKVSVLQVVVSKHDSESDFWSVAMGLARLSDHPASKAIVDYLPEQEKVMARDITQFTSFPGKGISGADHEETYYLGSVPFLQVMKVDTSEFNAQWKKETTTIVALAKGTKCLGYFLLADKLKPEAKEAVDCFHRLGMKVYLLSGDRTATTARLAKQIGADNFEAEILPERKAEHVAQLKKKGEVTAMVGDGVNDAPALATADIGIAIGAGVDVALESASVILMQSDLLGVAKTIVLSKKAFRKIRQNLYFAFGYNYLCIPFAAFGLLNPLIAGIAMGLSSISVVSNSLLLGRESINAEPRK